MLAQPTVQLSAWQPAMPVGGRQFRMLQGTRVFLSLVTLIFLTRRASSS